MYLLQGHTIVLSQFLDSSTDKLPTNLSTVCFTPSTHPGLLYRLPCSVTFSTFVTAVITTKYNKIQDGTKPKWRNNAVVKSQSN